jgi:hypothetical protein
MRSSRMSSKYVYFSNKHTHQTSPPQLDLYTHTPPNHSLGITTHHPLYPSLYPSQTLLCSALIALMAPSLNPSTLNPALL